MKRQEGGGGGLGRGSGVRRGVRCRSPGVRALPTPSPRRAPLLFRRLRVFDHAHEILLVVDVTLAVDVADVRFGSAPCWARCSSSCLALHARWVLVLGCFAGKQSLFRHGSRSSGRFFRALSCDLSVKHQVTDVWLARFDASGLQNRPEAEKGLESWWRPGEKPARGASPCVKKGLESWWRLGALMEKPGTPVRRRAPGFCCNGVP